MMDRPKHCLFCLEEGHWRQDCPEAQEYDRKKAERQTKTAGKLPSVAMVEIELLEPEQDPEVCAITRSGHVRKPRTSLQSRSMLDWPEQEVVRQQVKKWVQPQMEQPGPVLTQSAPVQEFASSEIERLKVHFQEEILSMEQICQPQSIEEL